MVCTWFVHGLYMVCTWFVHGLYMVCTWFVHGLYMVCKRFVHGLYMACTYLDPVGHLVPVRVRRYAERRPAGCSCTLYRQRLIPSGTDALYVLTHTCL